jgi:hypothetical protein
MKALARISIVLFLLTMLACSPEEPVRISSVPTIARPTTAAGAATPVTPPLFGPTSIPTPSPTRTAASTTAPGSTPNVACASTTGGSPLAASRLTAIRAAHNPGFDRVVFEWSGTAVPEFRIDVASSFRAPSDQPVRVDGNAFFSVRVTGQAHTDAPPPGSRSYAEPDPFHVALPAVRELKLVEDFEGTVIFALGMERSICPKALTLLNPTRIVVDFPTPP